VTNSCEDKTTIITGRGCTKKLRSVTLAEIKRGLCLAGNAETGLCLFRKSCRNWAVPREKGMEKLGCALQGSNAEAKREKGCRNRDVRWG
jgi:hypothetical protein